MSTLSQYQSLAPIMVITALLVSPITSIQAAEDGPTLLPLFSDYFTDGDDIGWTQINRFWRVAEGRYVLDGDYMPEAQGRDGYAVTHEGDRTWRNYAMSATFDHANPAGLPSPDAHNAIFFVRVQSPPPFGTFYRIDTWPFGTPDPRAGTGELPGGIVQIQKVVDGMLVDYADWEYSNSVAGTNMITVGVAGNTIEITINGEQVAAWTDASDPIRYGGVGIGAIWEVEAWFDNVLVRPAR